MCVPGAMGDKRNEFSAGKYPHYHTSQSFNLAAYIKMHVITCIYIYTHTIYTHSYSTFLTKTSQRSINFTARNEKYFPAEKRAVLFLTVCFFAKLFRNYVKKICSTCLCLIGYRCLLKMITIRKRFLLETETCFLGNVFHLMTIAQARTLESTRIKLHFRRVRKIPLSVLTKLKSVESFRICEKVFLENVELFTSIHADIYI